MEIGVYTFAELRGADGRPPVTADQRLRDVLEEAELAVDGYLSGLQEQLVAALATGLDAPREP